MPRMQMPVLTSRYSNSQNRLAILPVELLWQIFLELSLTDLYSLSKQNKNFRNIINDNFFFKRYYYQHIFPHTGIPCPEITDEKGFFYNFSNVVNIKGKNGLTQFQLVCQNGNVAAIDSFKYGARVNPPDYYSPQPLHFAVLSGNPDAVKLLLQQGAKANRQDNTFRTAFQRLDQLKCRRSQKKAIYINLLSFATEDVPIPAVRSALITRQQRQECKNRHNLHLALNNLTQFLTKCLNGKADKTIYEYFNDTPSNEFGTLRYDNIEAQVINDYLQAAVSNNNKDMRLLVTWMLLAHLKSKSQKNTIASLITRDKHKVLRQRIENGLKNKLASGRMTGVLGYKTFKSWRRQGSLSFNELKLRINRIQRFHKPLTPVDNNNPSINPSLLRKLTYGGLQDLVEDFVVGRQLDDKQVKAVKSAQTKIMQEMHKNKKELYKESATYAVLAVTILLPVFPIAAYYAIRKFVEARRINVNKLVLGDTVKLPYEARSYETNFRRHTAKKSKKPVIHEKRSTVNQTIRTTLPKVYTKEPQTKWTSIHDNTGSYNRVLGNRYCLYGSREQINRYKRKRKESSSSSDANTNLARADTSSLLLR